MEKNILLLPCAAGDHALQLQIEAEEGQVYLSILIPEFYAKQRSFLSRWGERVKLAFTVLRGREYVLEEVILNIEAMEELRIFLSRLHLTVTPGIEGYCLGCDEEPCIDYVQL